MSDNSRLEASAKKRRTLLNNTNGEKYETMIIALQNHQSDLRPSLVAFLQIFIPLL